MIDWLCVYVCVLQQQRRERELRKQQEIERHRFEQQARREEERRQAEREQVLKLFPTALLRLYSWKPTTHSINES